MNHTVQISTYELVQRAWAWMNSFQMMTNLISCGFLAIGVGIYLLSDEASGLRFPEIKALLDEISTSIHGDERRRLQLDPQLYIPAGGDYTAADEAVRGKARVDYMYQVAEAAAWHGPEPLMWLFIGVGFLLKFYAFFDQLVQPYMSLSVFMISITRVLSGDLMIFMSIFLCMILAFAFTMITVFPKHPDAGPLPQVADFSHWTTAVHAVIIAGFTGEPLELELKPEYLEPLGTWQLMNFFVFVSMYVTYIFLSMILLLNLLIALLGSTFSKTQESAALEGRMAYARMVLRLELLAEFFGLDTFAGQYDSIGDQYVHQFRGVVRDNGGELPRDYKDEAVFDDFGDAEDSPKQEEDERSTPPLPPPPPEVPKSSKLQPKEVKAAGEQIPNSTRTPKQREARTVQPTALAAPPDKAKANGTPERVKGSSSSSSPEKAKANSTAEKAKLASGKGADGGKSADKAKSAEAATTASNGVRPPPGPAVAQIKDELLKAMEGFKRELTDKFAKANNEAVSTVVSTVAQGMLEVMTQVSDHKSLVNAGLDGIRSQVDGLKEEVNASLAVVRSEGTKKMPPDAKKPGDSKAADAKKLNVGAITADSSSSASRLASDRLARSQVRAGNLHLLSTVME